MVLPSGKGFEDVIFIVVVGLLVAGGGMAVSGKALFTASQWEELERQKMIHKYIMASIPVPPQLLLPTSTTASLPSLSQSNSKLSLLFSFSHSFPYGLILA